MADLFERCASNPILRPADVTPTRDDFEVACLLNPGAFPCEGRIGLLMRVGERPRPEKGWVTTAVFDPQADGGVRTLRFKVDDPDLTTGDRRVFDYRGVMHVTVLSHLRLAWSDDGMNFAVDDKPTLVGEGDHETFSIEDARVALINGVYYLTYTAVSPFGVGVAMRSTRDWRTFDHHGIVIPPPNKDCALFPRKIGDDYFALHRPMGLGRNENNIWLASSPDLVHFGHHRTVATTRPGHWDGQRIGAGASPFETDAGWLTVYHGADDGSRYCLGTLLFDADDPRRVIGRSDEPVMEPTAPCELEGFFGNVVFTNGHVIDGDRITIYYGASDEVICAASASIDELSRTVR